MRNPRCLILLVKAIRTRVRNPQSLVYAARMIFFLCNRRPYRLFYLSLLLQGNPKAITGRSGLNGHSPFQRDDSPSSSSSRTSGRGSGRRIAVAASFLVGSDPGDDAEQEGDTPPPNQELIARDRAEGQHREICQQDRNDLKSEMPWKSPSSRRHLVQSYDAAETVCSRQHSD
jgi:hypothetical protein